ncbi:MAG: alpha/beta hydrolase [Thermotogaceae bacterium]|nr:alpha/beta hydrolase [Thermotogota bacterium]NLT45674.1 alpha/beta hydrolase [Thermotogaceae bacterium]
MKSLIIVISLLAMLLIAPFLIPVPDLADTVNPRTLADNDSMFAEINNIDIHYKISGEGYPLIILLHGFGASTFSWREVMEPLSEEFTVVAFDRPGFGLTYRPIGEELKDFNPYSLEGQVELTALLIQYFGFEKAILIGNSAGGLTALETALKYPDKVLGLVLVDAAIYTANADSFLFKILASTSQGRYIGPLVTRAFLGKSRDLLDLAWYDTSKLTPDILEGYEKPLKADNWDRALWELTLARKPYDYSRIPMISVPSLVITGDNDKIVPVEDSVRLAKELPLAQLSIIPDTGHLPHEESPGKFLEIVMPFLRSLATMD